MKVKLISCTPDLLNLLYTACRTCYNAGTPTDMLADIDEISNEKKLKLLNKVFKRGHLSTSEHSQFTFAIEGVSRAFLAQISRHRLMSLSVQSQRYVEFKESFDTISELFENPKTDKDEEYLMSIANKYFIDVNKDNYRMYIQALLSYLLSIKLGNKPEDARMFLPNATKTNMILTCNLRELMHLCNLRLCSCAQLEIRTVMNLMVKEVLEKYPWLKEYLVPKCEITGYCREEKSCGRKPKL